MDIIEVKGLIVQKKIVVIHGHHRRYMEQCKKPWWHMDIIEDKVTFVKKIVVTHGHHRGYMEIVKNRGGTWT